MSGDIEKTCRLCKTNLVIKGVISNTRILFSSPNAKERPLSERFRDVGVILPYRPGVYSGRICVKCFRLLVRVEESQITLKKWQAELNVTDTNEEGSRRGEKRDRDTPTKTPHKKKLCQSLSPESTPASRSSTTEVSITYPSKTERHRCDSDISGVINHLAKGNFTTAARLMVQHEDLMEALKPVMGAVIDKECQRLCQRREGFMLWKSSPEELKSFSLHNLGKDLARMAPFMFSLICIISGMQPNHACAAAAIALRGRENHLSAFAYYVNSVLQRGGARKAVFKRLSRMGITTTHANAVKHRMAKLKLNPASRSNTTEETWQNNPTCYTIEVTLS
ncbi:uncharacterized protein LOC122875739 [Siniperca chuatsi]|uniref:uncharacterized protein LOC122875739 n=1 Tax=Siniperca chuatsi TaxID=119488 RepID=UPI001CE0AD66|nr:uncharacterized protein LOC122875739 [Siniperca chuatsi]